MKIAYFIGTLKVEDGVTTVLLKLLREAQSRGIECLVITGQAEDPSISSVPVVVVPSVVFPLYKEYHLSIPGTKGFAQKLDAFKPDLIHIHSPDTIAWAALKYAKQRRVPIGATHHTDFGKYLSYYHMGFLSPILWFLLRRLYNQLRFVTTPSDVTTRDLIAHGVRGVRTIPWGVDMEKFNPRWRSQPWRQRINGQSEKKILLFISRLTWEKDLKTLAAAYQILRSHRKDFSMVIAGDGPARKDLERLMSGAVFLGHVGGKDLSETYASADILLFPSSTETFGNVTIEGMAAGLIPVVANAGGSQALVTDGVNGFLAEAKNAEEFARKVTLLLDQPELHDRMHKAGAEFVKTFSWAHVFERLLMLYQDTASKLVKD